MLLHRTRRGVHIVENLKGAKAQEGLCNAGNDRRTLVDRVPVVLDVPGHARVGGYAGGGAGGGDPKVVDRLGAEELSNAGAQHLAAVPLSGVGSGPRPFELQERFQIQIQIQVE